MARYRHRGTRPATPLHQLLMGAAMTLGGGWTILGSYGFVPFQKLLVAPWVVALIGLMLLAFGLLITGQTFHDMRKHRQAAEGTLDKREILPKEGFGGVFASWVGVLMFLGMPLMFLGAIHTGGPGSGNMPLWMLYGILILFTGVGLVLLSYTVPLTLSALRFGRVPLRLKTWPVRAGAPMEAELEFSRHPPFRTCSATLTGFGVGGDTIRQLKDGAKLRRRDDPLGSVKLTIGTVKLMKQSFRGSWQETRAVRVEKRGAYSVAPITFDVPGAGNQGSRLSRWEIKVASSVFGANFRRTYSIPVAAPLPQAPPDPEKVEAAERVIRAELTRGATPAQLADRLAALGNPEPIVLSAMERVAEDGASPFAAAVRDYLARRT